MHESDGLFGGANVGDEISTVVTIHGVGNQVDRPADLARPERNADV